MIKVTEDEFDLFLRVDSNTRGHLIWFYFSVKNKENKRKIKLNICNLRRPSKLYDQGMKAHIFSVKEWNRSGKDWSQGGEISIEKAELRYASIFERLQGLNLWKLSI